MIPLSDPLCQKIGLEIEQYSQSEMLRLCTALLTIPKFAANSIRLELLVHLIVIYCKGDRKPTRTLFNTLVNDLLGGTQVAMMEDPIEDVFVSNVLAKTGDCRVFNGLWEANDYHTQTLVDLLQQKNLPNELVSAKNSCLGLLRISEEVADSLQLHRNAWEDSTDKADIVIPPISQLKSTSRKLLFTEESLNEFGVSVEAIQPFVMNQDDLHGLSKEVLGNSLFEKKPISKLGDEYLLALPNSVGIAIRWHFLKCCQEHDLLEDLQNALANYQTKQLFGEVLHEYRGEAESITLKTNGIEDLPPLRQLVLRDSSNNHLNVILVHDDLKSILENGVDSLHQLTSEQSDSVKKLIVLTATQCNENVDNNYGHLLLVHGGLGRGFIFSIGSMPEDWCFVCSSLNDLLLLSSSKSRPLKEFLECIRQKSWAEDNGVVLNNINGDINFFGFWRENHNLCVPTEMEISDGINLVLTTDHTFPVRRELRTSGDRHSAMDIDGKWKPVERLSRNSFFEGMKYLPIYVSIDDASKGQLNGLVESTLVNLWFVVSGYPDGIQIKVVYEWWSGFINIIYDILGYLQAAVPKSSTVVTAEVCLDFSILKPISHETLSAESGREITASIEQNRVIVTPEENFLANFAQPENFGEQKLISTIGNSLREILALLNIDITEHIDDAIKAALGGEGVRVIHVLTMYNPADLILFNESKEPNLVQEYKTQFCRIQLGKTLKLSKSTLATKNECKEILHTMVDVLWAEIRDVLQSLNKESTIKHFLYLLNDIEQDRTQWSRTAKAVKAIHEKHDDVTQVAQKREGDRSKTLMCVRGLIEMALCESSESGGSEITEELTDKLLSSCAQMIAVAYDSDAIHWGLIEPKLETFNNGLHQISTDIYSAVITPYLSGHFENTFNAQIESYPDLYNVEPPRIVEKENFTLFTADYTEAFVAEYGFPPDVLTNGIREIIELLVEKGLAVDIIQRDVLIHRMQNSNISHSHACDLINSFSLSSRVSWEQTPEGYAVRDVMPWKYKRKMSCLVKPLLKMDNNKIVCSLALLKLGVAYFLDRSINGMFQIEFFDSTTMRSYIGTLIERNGAEFTSSVAQHFEAKGWIVEKEVQMSRFIAPKELGDIDVLAYKQGTLIVVECKRLQMAKTVSEIADVCNRFRGESKDELEKHINRVNWVSKNLDTITDAFSEMRPITDFDHSLLTSTEMPMRYLNNLPIDSKKIVSFGRIDEISG